MARTVVPLVYICRDGVIHEAIPGDVDNGMLIPNQGHTALVATNMSGTDETLTFLPSIDVDGLTTLPRQVVIPAGKVVMIGPFPPTVFNVMDEASNEPSVRMDVSAATVLVAAYAVS